MKSKSKRKKIYKYTAFFEKDETGGYIVYVPALPGCVSQGEDFEEAQCMIRDAIKGYITVLKEDGDPIPIEQAEVITAPIFVPISSAG